jgi:hypothetical protein
MPAELLPLMRAESRVSFSTTGGRVVGERFSPPDVIFTIPCDRKMDGAR